mgnify:CR=1 FL=1
MLASIFRVMYPLLIRDVMELYNQFHSQLFFFGVVPEVMDDMAMEEGIEWIRAKVIAGLDKKIGLS